MKIKMNGIGKIVDADIEMKGVTVIAGYNNTGKSTILKAIYTGLNIFRSSESKISEERKRSINNVVQKCESYFDDSGYDVLPSDLLNELAEILNSNLSKLLKSEKEERFEVFKELFVEAIAPYSDIITNILNGDSIYTDNFIEPLFEKINIVFERSREDYVKFYGELYIKNVFLEQLNNISGINSARIDIEAKSGKNYICIENNKIKEMSYNLTFEPDAIYIPSYGILDIINRRSISGRYSPEGDIRRYLLANNKKNYAFEEYNEIEENSSIIKEIIEDTIHGELELSSNGTILFKDKELNKSINLSNTASGMKKFLLIEKFIENGALRKDSILLIDEPETNLHPEWHLKFAEILVLLYKEMGIVSVINSHSPYFIRAIEVKLADYGMKKNGKYYLMENEERNLYRAKDVTAETNLIYKKLYKPLEYL